MKRTETQKNADKVYEDKRKSKMTSIRTSKKSSEQLGALAKNSGYNKSEALDGALINSIIDRFIEIFDDNQNAWIPAIVVHSKSLELTILTLEQEGQIKLKILDLNKTFRLISPTENNEHAVFLDLTVDESKEIHEKLFYKMFSYLGFPSYRSQSGSDI